MSYNQFHFDGGQNPYGIFRERTDEFFRMIIAWQPTMTGAHSFDCPVQPTKAYYEKVSYDFKKEALREFAKEYQRASSDFVMSYDDLAFYSDFFSKYGKRY